jgi:hypothetical protein
MNYNDKDTMYVHADTLVSVTDSTGKEKIVRAYFHVKIFKQDMQGKCDSLSYTTADSTIRLFHLPVLWSDENQLTSNYIELHMANKKPNTADLYGNCFIISMADSNKFNQIKGRNMIGFFKDNELYKVAVFGNGQTIYFAPEKNEIIGMNKAESSDLIIFIEKRKIKKIEFLTKPSAILYPIIKAPAEEQKFRDFKWYTKSRPDNKDEIFFWQDE